jgi:hypothetical protein
MFVYFYVCVFLCLFISMIVYFYVCVFLCLCISMFVYMSDNLAVRFESVFTKSLNDLLIEFLSKLSLSQVKPTKSFLSFEFEKKKNFFLKVLLNKA